MNYFQTWRVLGKLIILLIAFTTYAEDRFYVGGLIGPGINYFTNDKDYINIHDAEHASFAWNLFAGYKLNDIVSLEIGYLDLGFYENAGDGKSICDTKGNCGYPSTIPFERFHTNLTVVNDVTAQFFYSDFVFNFLKFGNWSIFTKLGVAYNDINMKSYVDVFPNIRDIGVEVQQTVNSASKVRVAPHVAIGYEYQATEHLFIRSEFDYFSSQDLISTTDDSAQGTLYPYALLFGTRLAF